MELGYTDRENKPRNHGLNLTIDVGLPTGLFCDYLESFSTLIDGVKFGWGSGIATPDIDKKIAALKEKSIPFWFGGTAFEIAYKSSKLDEFLNWVESKGASHFELSDGVIELPSDIRRNLIKQISERFEV